MNTHPSRPIGFRRTQHGDAYSIPWRLWVGPLLVSRTPGNRRFGWWSARRAGWDSPSAFTLIALGVSIGWVRR